MNAKQIWQTTTERLQTRVSSAIFTTWFQGTSAISFQRGVFVVRVPTTFAKAHLEGRFLELIRSLLSEVTGENVEVQFIVARERPDSSAPSYTSPSTNNAASQTPPRRTYRMGKGRIAAALRGKRMQEPTEPSVPPTPHFNQEPEHPEEQFSAPATVHQNIQKSPLPAESATEFAFAPSAGPPIEGLLNSRYTFNTFIVGKSNQLGHAASLAVSENPGRIYNPLFLYGGVGLGKTHLMHAIGHAGETAGLHVLYTTSEKFTNEIINAIRFQQTEEFRAKYRRIDILLVDDIQFIAGKESTEEEFFHTFNTLHNANKQIVVTSDRPPKAINSLQDRLRSRFEWGLLADVQPPEYEHRLAILRSKAESLRFTVPVTVIDYIARPVYSNVRELEGALNRVIAFATLHDAPLSVHLATQALEHIYETKPVAKLTVNEVLDGICRYYHVELEMLRGKQRDRDIVWPRQVAMYLMREETTASLLQIGMALGGRDHTTIMHGWEKVHGEIANNEKARQEIAEVLDSLRY